MKIVIQNVQIVLIFAKMLDFCFVALYNIICSVECLKTLFVFLTNDAKSIPDKR